VLLLLAVQYSQPAFTLTFLILLLLRPYWATRNHQPARCCVCACVCAYPWADAFEQQQFCDARPAVLCAEAEHCYTFWDHV